jgi:hypothetical protein
MNKEYKKGFQISKNNNRNERHDNTNNKPLFKLNESSYQRTILS